MQELLDELDEWLQENRPNYYARLLPGLTDAELADFEDRLGLPLPEDLRTLYRWKNGQPPDSVTDFFTAFAFMPLEDVVNQKSSLDELIEFNDFDGWWSPNWIPFLGDARADNYCLDMEGSFGGIKGQVILVIHDDGYRYIYFPSLTKWLETLVKGLQQGLAITNAFDDYDEPGNYEVAQAFIKAENPGYPIEIPPFGAM